MLNPKPAVFALLCASSLAPVVAAAATSSGHGVQVQVLGSGGPELEDKRASSSYLVWQDGRPRILIDSGGGSALRFGQSGAHLAQLDAVLFTHLHIDHNATSHEDGLGPLWDTRKAFWNDRSEYETAVEQNLMSLAAARQRHVGTSPDPGVYNPDLWTDEYAMLSRPGETAIQSDLFSTTIEQMSRPIPRGKRGFRKTQPKTLVIWGRYDPSQLAAEAAAYGRDLPHAEIHMMDAGHFALDLAPDADAIAEWMRDFLGRNGL